MPKKIVLTGGPSTGKTAIINELLEQNYTCIEEVSREVTRQAKKRGVAQLFLKDPLIFSEHLLEAREKQYLEAEQLDVDIVFFDRGIPDVQAYLEYANSKYPQKYTEKSNIYRYDKVFITPPWLEIFTQDEERYENYEQSLKIYEYLKSSYENLNYNLIEIPKGTIKERVKFVLDTI